MRNTARWAAALGLTAAAVCGPLTGTAVAAPVAAPSSLYAPSALVLTTGHGSDAATATPERAVTLSCAPTASGTHPASFQACAELRWVGGDFDALQPRLDVWCTKLYDPVVVTAQGVWEGKRVSYERTFGNMCMRDATGSVFAF
ncbi:protease inhibitor protein [Streptomyces pluripotens]|uniref:Probable subtilase-type protease inhibitor n=1 Tax=Streptomyces pluripotens TaxID=1355015 RepID=A0A221NSX9_9ACTN|nr:MULTISPECIES: subtilase-type protease inhibitor [Streptomyces]ARP68766.1 protease inhibitor protein [Streptomyces pluripotens]ASN23022.1 protease inhibitor protein [Streptomyces pluripotens]KIE27838.1 protease inhibitor protein [Streptomyces sp. MUSC 125]MCH0558500.1 subtilase-type protease inhibitor [Streptomyces sp. MUM 16J]